MTRVKVEKQFPEVFHNIMISVLYAGIFPIRGKTANLFIKQSQKMMKCHVLGQNS